MSAKPDESAAPQPLRAPSAKIVLAFALSFPAMGLVFLFSDPTPLLAEPKPDLDWLFGLAGVGLGLWAAFQVWQLPYMQRRKLPAASLWIMLPFWLRFGLPALWERTFETVSFRSGSHVREETVLIVEKDIIEGKRRTSYEVEIVSPIDESRVSIDVDPETYDRAQPLRECVTLLVEQAPNGVTRLLRPLQWHVQCPWVRQ